MRLIASSRLDSGVAWVTSTIGTPPAPSTGFCRKLSIDTAHSARVSEMAAMAPGSSRTMENFAADLERGGGQLAISQTDLAKFKVGENVATAPGKVVYQNDILQLLQFTPTTETVHEIPLLIFPPWINKFYILDLRPENSMIRWLTGQGFTVFVASWVNPDNRQAAKTFEDYMPWA